MNQPPAFNRTSQSALFAPISVSVKQTQTSLCAPFESQLGQLTWEKKRSEDRIANSWSARWRKFRIQNIHHPRWYQSGLSIGIPRASTQILRCSRARAERLCSSENALPLPANDPSYHHLSSPPPACILRVMPCKSVSSKWCTSDSPRPLPHHIGDSSDKVQVHLGHECHNQDSSHPAETHSL